MVILAMFIVGLALCYSIEGDHKAGQGLLIFAIFVHVASLALLSL